MSQQVTGQHKEAQDFIYSFERFKDLTFIAHYPSKNAFVTSWAAYYKDAETWVYIRVTHEATGLKAKYRFEDEEEWRDLK